VARLEETIEILSLDPFNKTGKYPIKKLQGVAAGEGQYRLRSGSHDGGCEIISELNQNRETPVISG